MGSRTHGARISSAEIPAGTITLADIAAGVISGAKLTATFAKLMSFTGSNGAGACTATGLAVGDRVVALVGITSGNYGNKASLFESVVTVADQIQQSSVSNLSAVSYVALVIPASA